MSAVTVLSEPCTRTVVHVAHAMDVVSPYTPSMVTTLSCPGWTSRPQPDPLPLTTS